MSPRPTSAGLWPCRRCQLQKRSMIAPGWQEPGQWRLGLTSRQAAALWLSRSVTTESASGRRRHDSSGGRDDLRVVRSSICRISLGGTVSVRSGLTWHGARESRNQRARRVGALLASPDGAKIPRGLSRNLPRDAETTGWVWPRHSSLRTHLRFRGGCSQVHAVIVAVLEGAQ